MFGLAALLLAPAYASAGTVVVKDTDKSAKVKIGDTVDIEIPNPVAKDVKKDFKVDEKGKLFDKAKMSDDTHKGVDGKPLANGGYKSIKMKATAKGTEKVKVSWMLGGKTESKEFDITVE
jgi:hypothetical protein